MHVRFVDPDRGGAVHDDSALAGARREKHSTGETCNCCRCGRAHGQSRRDEQESFIDGEAAAAAGTMAGSGGLRLRSSVAYAFKLGPERGYQRSTYQEGSHLAVWTPPRRLIDRPLPCMSPPPGQHLLHTVWFLQEWHNDCWIIELEIVVVCLRFASPALCYEQWSAMCLGRNVGRGEWHIF